MDITNIFTSAFAFLLQLQQYFTRGQHFLFFLSAIVATTTLQDLLISWTVLIKLYFWLNYSYILSKAMSYTCKHHSEPISDGLFYFVMYFYYKFLWIWDKCSKTHTILIIKFVNFIHTFQFIVAMKFTKIVIGLLDPTVYGWKMYISNGYVCEIIILVRSKQ